MIDPRMTGARWVRTVLAAALVTGPMLLPAAADQPMATLQAARTVHAELVGGVLAGTLRDSRGQVIDGALIVARRDGQEVARTVTARDGRYRLVGLTSGRYDVTAGRTVVAYQVWERAIAPPRLATSADLQQQPGQQIEAAPVMGTAIRGNHGTPTLGGGFTSGAAGMVTGSTVGLIGGAAVLGGVTAIATSQDEHVDARADAEDRLREERAKISAVEHGD